MRNFTAMILDDHYLVRYGLASVAQNIPGLSLVGSYERSKNLITAMALNEPDIVFLDLSLHIDDIDGKILIGLLKRRFSNVKIIVISTYAKAGIVYLALRAGANGFCSKGTTATELEIAIRCVLNGRTYVSEHLRC